MHHTIAGPALQDERPVIVVDGAAGPAMREPPASTSIRTDIQALRALAVSGVLLYHLWPHRLTGGFAGVDVFFVISGFLITTHLVAHPPNQLRNLVDFWSRRIRRLLPAALLVLAAVLVASRLVAPPTQWEATATQSRAAALYVVNWRLAADAVDYLAARNVPTPVQHFWSLAVEEQFYLFWPVLILVLVVLARVMGWPAAPLVFGGMAVVVGGSLWYSIQETQHDPARAFFVTPARVWELGIGGLLAMVIARRRLGRHRSTMPVPSPGIAAVLVWSGLGAIALAMFEFDAKTSWPGWHALVPTLGCVAVIAAGNPSSRWAPTQLLAARPIQWLGNVSYSLYLWHWPLIVLVPSVSGGHLGRLDKAAIVVASLVLAALSKHFVEDPFRRPRWARPALKPFGLAAAGMAVVVAGAAIQVAEVHHRAAQALAAVDRKLAQHDPCFGAPALVNGPRRCPRVTSGTLTPDPVAALVDRAPGFPVWTGGRRDCFANPPTFTGVICRYGPTKASVRVAVVGNSHANEFLPPLQAIADARGWQITTYVANSCALNAVTQYPVNQAGASAGCGRWVRWATEQVTRGNYDLVVVANRVQVGAAAMAESPTPTQYAQGYVSVLRALHSAGEPVLAIRDTPAPGVSIPACLAQHESNYSACDGTRSKWMPADPLVAAVDELNDADVTLLDLADHICEAVVCPAVIGGVPVYFDDSHLTATFARTLVPYMLPAVEHAIRP